MKALCFVFIIMLSAGACVAQPLPRIASLWVTNNQLWATALLTNTPTWIVWEQSVDLKVWTSCSTTQLDQNQTSMFLPLTGPRGFLRVHQVEEPAAPTNLLAVALSDTSISLVWWDGNNTNSPTQGYYVQKQVGSNWVNVATNNLPFETSFLDTNCVASTTYWYRVVAYN